MRPVSPLGANMGQQRVFERASTSFNLNEFPNIITTDGPLRHCHGLLRGRRGWHRRLLATDDLRCSRHLSCIPSLSDCTQPPYPVQMACTSGTCLVLTLYGQKLMSPQQVGSRFDAHRIPHPHLKSHEMYEDLAPYQVPGREYITCFDPATSFHLDTILADNEEEISQKIGRASEAQKEWKNVSFRDRRRVIRSLKKWLVDNQEMCARVACRDTGKTCECILHLRCDLPRQW